MSAQILYEAGYLVPFVILGVLIGFINARSALRRKEIEQSDVIYWTLGLGAGFALYAIIFERISA